MTIETDAEGEAVAVIDVRSYDVPVDARRPIPARYVGIFTFSERKRHA